MDTKEVISKEAFTKKMEIESANLQHFEHLSKYQADKQARDYVSKKFEIKQ